VADETELLKEALRLPPKARAELAERLLISLDDEPLKDDPLHTVLNERLRQLETGAVQGVSEEEAFQRLDRIVNGHGSKA
jgi:hypothetical protein